MPHQLLVDIGNSSIEYAPYRQGKIGRSRRLETGKVQDWLSTDPFAAYDRVIVSSVVPQVDRLLRRYSMVTVIDFKNLPILKIEIDRPHQIGTDRIVNALAAYQRFQSSVLVVDSGTATTFCYVDSNGRYLGGIITAGMGISSKALALFTAKIPLIRVSPQSALFGKTTREAVEIGLYRGTIHMINGIIEDFKIKDSGVTVIGTGHGLLPVKSELALDEYDPILILKGLAVCAESLTGV
jgi:type III pantothenate kinase